MPSEATGAPRRRRRLGGQFLGFAMVGAVGFVIDAGVLQAMIDLGDAGPYRGRAVSFAVAVTATWLLNRTLVFGAGPHGRGKEYRRYFTVQAVGSLINLSIYALLIETLAVMAAYPVLALAAGAAAALVFNFAASKKLVFDGTRPAAATESSASEVGGSENLEVMAAAVNYNRYLLRLIETEARGAARLLDFGAGRATFAAPLAERGREVVSVEPDKRLHEFFVALGLEVHETVTDLPSGSIPFVYSLNVLEHIDDDVSALKAIHSRLARGGRMLIYVPAFQVLYSAMDRKVGHVRRYRKRQLVDRVRRAGFRVERAQYADSLGFLAALVYRAVGDGSGDIDENALRIYDRFVFPVSRFLDFALSPFFGKNLVVVAYRR